MKNDNLNAAQRGLKALEKDSDLPASGDIVAKNSRPISDQQIVFDHSSIKNSEGLNLIAVMLETAFFFSLFEYMAHRRFSGRTDAVRIGKMVDRHPYFYVCSIVFDFITRFFVVTALVIAAGYSVYKVLR